MSLVQPFGLIERIATLAGLAATLFQTIHSTLRAVQQPPQQSRELHDETLLVSDLLKALGSAVKLDNLSVAWERSIVSLDNAISQCTDLVQEIFARIGDTEPGRRWWPFTQTETADYLRKLGKYKNVFRMVLEATGGYI
jgi:hypothetical protein